MKKPFLVLIFVLSVFSVVSMFRWATRLQASFFGHGPSIPALKSIDASYLIIGSGIFGASTALHLIRKYSHAKVTIIDREPFPCRLAASWDWNKVVRADYTDLLYMKLALEAKEVWSNDKLFKQFYHQSGMFWISDTDLARTVIDNYKALSAKEEFEILNVEEAKKLYGGMFEDADFTGVTEILINNSSGHAEAKEALGGTIQAAVDAGAQYLEADVRSLVLDEEGACKGVKTATGETLTATHIILCTGAGTAQLLADTTPYQEKLQVAGRMAAAAICTGLAKLDPESASKYAKGPVCCQDVLPGRGGSLPPTAAGEFKFWRDVSFKNTIQHASGQFISVPDYEQLPTEKMKEEVMAVKMGVFGQLGTSLKLEEYRICWDAITPSEDFIISAHTHSKHLYIATAGSFHGWKFLPIIGKYVVDMLDGVLEPVLAETWAWDKRIDGISDVDMWPTREMKDLD